MWSVKTKSGKVEFRETYKDPLTNKRKTACVTMSKDTAAIRKLASQQLADIIKEKTSTVSSENITLIELYKRYIVFQKKTVKQGTWIRNERTLKKIIPIIGNDIIVDRLTAAYVKDKLLSITKVPGTLNEYIKRLKAMFNWGYESDYITNYNIIKKLTKLPDKTKREKIQNKYLEPEEIHLLLDYMRRSQELWYHSTKILILSGMRVGEYIALNDKDVSTKFIHIDKTYDVNNDIIGTPKTPDSYRDIDIQNELALAIKDLKKYLRSYSILTGVRSNIFAFGSDGGYISYRAYEKYFKETCHKVLNKDLTIHALRHTHVSLLASEGVPLDTIMRRLGHSDSRITREIYLHITKKIRENDTKILFNTKIL